jgi:alpha-mannosidase
VTEQSIEQPIEVVPERGPLYMVGNAHIDPVWLWQWPEGYTEVRATFSAALDRMDEYPEFVFTCDSVAYLGWVEEHDPELFGRIRQRVAEGRWEIVGGWWVEPDCNMPAGESFARHALYSQRWLADRFGITATVGCNVDPFGHNAMLPQLLRKGGMDAYTFLRPQVHELGTLPAPLFWWQAADGSRVLAYRLPHEYCSPPGELSYHVSKSLAQLPHTDKPLMCFYGVGNHGGGPTRANLDSIRDLNRRDLYPPMACSSARDFFDKAGAASDEVPVWRTELQPHAVGCYSAHSGIKQWNRRAENALLAAEKWATVARFVAGMPPSTQELGHAWKQVLFNQFHDIAAGTAIKPAYDDARDQLGEACSIAARVQNRSVQSISRRVDIPALAGTSPVVVFNPHPWPVRATVELEFGAFREHAELVDDGGDPVPVQQTRSAATAGGRRRLAFVAEVDGLGYRLYRLRPATAAPAPAQPAAVAADGRIVLENEHLRAAIDPATGWLSTLEHGGIGLIDGHRPHAVVFDDWTDTWGHGVRSYREVAGTFAARSVRVVEHGPVRTVVRAESAYRDSTLVEEFVLTAGLPYLEVRVTVDWHERLRGLKLRFPTALADPVATAEIPYGHLVRSADGRETPHQNWVDVSGTVGGRRAGLSVLNDAKYAGDANGADLGMTVVRSPVYAWHDPQPLDPDEPYDHLDQGVQRFTYRLLPHGGDWRAAGTARAGTELNQPPVALLECYHDGPLPPRHSFAALSTVEGAAPVVSVLKLAEDDPDTVVVRAYDPSGRGARTVLDLPFLDRRVPLDLDPAEIRTLRLPPGGDPTDLDLVERPWESAHRPAGPEADPA